MSESKPAKGIFAETAPRYFAAGISVMPLYPKQKRPIFDDWSQWRHRLPAEEMQADWVHRYPNYNIGLVLGESSKLVAVDVDTDDPKLLAAIESVLPPSPWVRKGKRGYVKMYRWNNNKLKHIKDELGVGYVDILSGGAQVVLPPSIHPDTQLPYEANCELIDVLDQLVPAPEDLLEKLEAALTLAGVVLKKNSKAFNTVDFVSAGSRDVQMVQYAGLMSNAIQRGELSVLRALNNMQAWCENFVQDVAGDPIDVNKGKNKVIEFLLVDLDKKRTVLKPGWDEGLTQEEKESWGLNFSEEVQEWTYNQLHEFISGKFHEHADANNPLKREAIEYTLNKIHKSTSLTSLEVDNLLSFIAKNSGQKVPVAAYRKRLKEMSQGEVAGVNHTELAQATVKEFAEKGLILRHDKGEFWKWIGSHWVELEDSEIERVIALNFGHMDAAKRYSDITGVRKTMVPIVDKGIQTVPAVGVNFANGFLTDDLRLLPHSPDFGMTYTMPFRYLANTHEPKRFLQMCRSFWGHKEDCEEIIQALREALGATIFGLGAKLQRAICLYGPGGTGKSQLLDVLSFLVPEIARCAASPETWAEPYVPATFFGKLLNISGELPDKKYIEGKNFKEIITGDEIETRRIYGAPFKFRPTAMHWFGANRLPRSRDTSRGFNRRWLFLEFERIIRQEERILDLGKSIGREEIEQIAAWAIASVPALLKRGEYTEPKSHLKLQADMSLQNSNVRQFMKACVTYQEGKEVPEENAYKAYWSYVVSHLRGNALPQQQFYVEFRQIVAEYDGEGYGKRTSGDATTYLNMLLKDAPK